MRKVIVLEHISLDSVIQAPGGPDEDTSGGFAYGGWTGPYSDAILGTVLKRQMNMPFDLLLGRKTLRGDPSLALSERWRCMSRDAASQLVGTWRLISYSSVTPDGVTTHPFGMYAQGRLIYEANGRMAVQIARPGQAPFVSGDPRAPTDAEAQAAYDRYLAYYGTYSVDPVQATVAHHVEVSLTPDWAGGDQVRHFKLEGQRLTLTTPPALFGGVKLVATLIWEKLS